MQEETIISSTEAPSNGQELQIVDEVVPSRLTILPLLQRPVFPGLVLPVPFTGQAAVDALQNAVKKEDSYIGLSLIREANEESILESDFYEMGTAMRILRIVPNGPDSVQVLMQGLNRFRRKRVLHVQPSLRWEVEHFYDSAEKPNTELKAYMLAISNDMKELLQLNELFKEQINMVVSQLNYDAPGKTMDIISNILSADTERLQGLLETLDFLERAEILLQLIKEELEVGKIQQKISQQIEQKINEQQKEFYLREQLKAIKKELGIEKEDKDTDIEKIEQKIAQLTLTDEARQQVEAQLEKLKLLNAQSPEYNVVRSYLELITDLPWGIYSEDNMDIRKARRILNKEHYGLKEVKDLILEFLSAVIRRGKVAGSIICLVGPPGVGKTSIGKSVASALNRKFFRFSVGGMRDEAEIKGHRRTYIGAMPGKLIQSLKRVGTSNPVVMLDEIDKIGSSFQGDPASALLEVLDPEQNGSFLDHYLDIPYDLSNILFITTANQLDTIPRPLLDRMEIIRLSGYVLEEKVEIAKRHLLPKQLQEHGFEKGEINITDEALATIVDRYAREAGVRNLEKQIRKIIRKATLKLAEKKKMNFEIGIEEIESYLGKNIFRTEKLYTKSIPGVVLGLAYTSMGGATLYIEATAIKAKNGSFKLTGQLGSVMQESAQIAYSYIRSLLSEEAPNNDFFETHMLHLHVPAGATPKDGPSAGITMALALYSLATGQAVKDNLAMTGELTLTGKVLPIGGVKEKTIGAKRVGVSELIFPIDNKKDYRDLPIYIRRGIKARFADYFKDVLKVAFAKNK
ncbi:MAG: endopeptidase La [Bacteroidota bacterium]